MKLPDMLQIPNIRAAFYGRHSTAKQDIETQKHICEQFADKHDMTIVQEYIDENVSGFKTALNKRKQMEQLRKDAREGKFDCVLVYKADRLARQITQHMKIWGEFRELGVPIILAESEKLYTTDEPNEIMIEIGLSSFESENTRIRSRDYYNAHTEKGKWLGGILPFGYRYEEDEDGNKVITQISGDVEIVKHIFYLYKQGYGFKRIANMMNEENTDKRWTQGHIKMVITNPFYAGYTTSQRIVPGSGSSVQPRENWKMGRSEKIPPCIPKELWEECMEIYEKKSRGAIGKDTYITPYLFKDVLKCKDCDRTLQTKNYSSGKKSKNGTRYGQRLYICPECKVKWEVEKMNKILIDYILSGWHYLFFSLDKEQLQEEFKDDMEKEIRNVDEKISKYKKEILKLQSKLNEGERKQKELMFENPEPDPLIDALVQFRISIQTRIDHLNKEIDSLEREKKNLDMVYGDSKRFKEFITTNTDFAYRFNEDPRLRQLILFLLESISVGADYSYDVVARVDLEQEGIIKIGH